MRILVVRLSAIGDVAVTANAVYSLRESLPDAKIDWAVEEEASSLVSGFNFVNDIILIPRRRYSNYLVRNPFRLLRLPTTMLRFLHHIRRNYDVVLDFQGNFRSGLLTLLSGAKKRIGFSAGRVYEASHIFYTTKVRLPHSPINRVEKMFRLLNEIGVKKEPIMRPVPFEFSPNDKAAVERFLYEQRAFNKKLLVVHPGASKFGEFKRWSIANYAALCYHLANDPDALIVITWSGEELLSAIELVKLSRNNKTIIAPRFETIRQLAYLLKRSSLVIGGDTGPLHIAALFETPSIALFGPKDPIVYRPWNKNCRVVRGDVPCSPCRKRRCSEKKCMEAITVEMVLDAVKNMLENASPVGSVR